MYQEKQEQENNNKVTKINIKNGNQKFESFL